MFNFPGRGGRRIPKDLPLQILIIFCLSCPGDLGEALLSLHTLEQLACLQAPKGKMQLVSSNYLMMCAAYSHGNYGT